MIAKREDIGVKGGFLFFKMGAVTIWLYADRIDTPKKKKKLIKHNIEGEMARAKCLSRLEEMRSRVHVGALALKEEKYYSNRWRDGIYDRKGGKLMDVFGPTDSSLWIISIFFSQTRIYQ